MTGKYFILITIKGELIDIYFNNKKLVSYCNNLVEQLNLTDCLNKFLYSNSVSLYSPINISMPMSYNFKSFEAIEHISDVVIRGLNLGIIDYNPLFMSFLSLSKLAPALLPCLMFLLGSIVHNSPGFMVFLIDNIYSISHSSAIWVKQNILSIFHNNVISTYPAFIPLSRMVTSWNIDLFLLRNVVRIIRVIHRNNTINNIPHRVFIRFLNWEIGTYTRIICNRSNNFNGPALRVIVQDLTNLILEITLIHSELSNLINHYNRTGNIRTLGVISEEVDLLMEKLLTLQHILVIIANHEN